MVRRMRLVFACALLAGCGAETALRPSPASALVAGPVLRGGQLSPGVDAAGMLRLPTGPFRAFGHPVAVAAFGADVYVMDAALGMLVRLDPNTGVLAQFPGQAYQPGTRIAVDADLSFYLLDPVNRRVQRFSRDGRLLVNYAANATVGRLTDIVLDPARGRLLAADGLYAHLIAFRALGRAFEVLPLRDTQRHALGALGAIALGPEAIFATDPRCACLARIAFDGRVLATFGHGRVRQPGRLVVDRFGRVIVFDRADRKLKVFIGERLAEEIDVAGFGLREATDLALADGWLYVADGPGAQVRMLRVQPPAKGKE